MKYSYDKREVAAELELHRELMNEGGIGFIEIRQEH